MKTTDILRSVLELIDNIEQGQEDKVQADVTVTQNAEPDNRFRQILALLNKDSFGGLANAPDEQYADVDSVTTLAGGGVNGPKHPADIRVKDPGYGHGS